ncbi:hypothetical protein BJV74DRAFT_290667 [Russula compacta]|nr:hypothetical protein BJV74DRAFT_290667 [Russula compacta]
MFSQLVTMLDAVRTAPASHLPASGSASTALADDSDCEVAFQLLSDTLKALVARAAGRSLRLPGVPKRLLACSRCAGRLQLQTREMMPLCVKQASNEEWVTAPTATTLTPPSNIAWACGTRQHPNVPGGNQRVRGHTNSTRVLRYVWKPPSATDDHSDVYRTPLPAHIISTTATMYDYVAITNLRLWELVNLESSYKAG